jgi:hypothetical protein
MRRILILSATVVTALIILVPLCTDLTGDSDSVQTSAEEPVEETGESEHSPSTAGIIGVAVIIAILVILDLRLERYTSY